MTKSCATNRKFVGSITAGVSGDFHWHKILPIALWPWGRLGLEQKWVPGAFRGGKGGRCVRLITLSPSCAVVMKSGILNFLEPSGPLQACSGTALPFTVWQNSSSIEDCSWRRVLIIYDPLWHLKLLLHYSKKKKSLRCLYWKYVQHQFNTRVTLLSDT